MMYPGKVAKAVFWSTFRRTRQALHIPARPKRPIATPTEEMVKRFHLLCDWLQMSVPDAAWESVKGNEVCEIGPGECPATAALMLARGAKHVDYVEHDPPIITGKHLDVINQLKSRGFPMDAQIITNGGVCQLNPEKVTVHRTFMEHFTIENRYDLIYSLNVGEHVEELDGFFRACYRATKRGGWNMHIIDLGGHNQFEEPVPPLDFQTYPDWIYNLMYPPYYRNTRRFVAEYRAAAESAGFCVQGTRPITRADPEYVKRIWPKLRPDAQSRSPEEVATIEFALVAQKL
jgi:hypothetical protein